jgi:hypothetical protein
VTDDPTVTVRHTRHLGYCARGCREFFLRHNLSWPEFVAHGLPASTFDRTGDPLAVKLGQLAREEAARGQEQ